MSIVQIRQKVGADVENTTIYNVQSELHNAQTGSLASDMDRMMAVMRQKRFDNGKMWW